MDIDLAHARAHAENAARSVGDFLRSGHGVAPVTKSKSESAADVVTAFDSGAESRLFTELSVFDAAIGFEGEESGTQGSRSTYWLVDPIDGTGHFMRGNPFSTCMITLVDNDAPKVSVIYDFVSDTMYSCAAGLGATRNGERIHVAERALRDCYLAVELNLEFPENGELMARLQRICVPMATINCGWEFASTACGRIDGRLQRNAWGSTWDFAAGALLVAEAGGVVVNLGSDAYDFRNLDFIATSRKAYDDLTAGPDPLLPSPS